MFYVVKPFLDTDEHGFHGSKHKKSVFIREIRVPYHTLTDKTKKGFISEN